MFRLEWFGLAKNETLIFQTFNFTLYDLRSVFDDKSTFLACRASMTLAVFYCCTILKKIVPGQGHIKLALKIYLRQDRLKVRLMCLLI